MVFTNTELLEDIRKYMEAHDGTRPRYKDLRAYARASCASIQTYIRRFGAFRHAVDQAVAGQYITVILAFDDEDANEDAYTDVQTLTIAQEVICDTMDIDVYPANFGYTGWSEDYGAVKIMEAEQDADGKFIFDLTGDYEPDTYVLVGWSKYERLDANVLMKFVLVIDTACLIGQSYIKVTDEDSKHWNRCSMPVGPFNKNLVIRRMNT